MRLGRPHWPRLEVFTASLCSVYFRFFADLLLLYTLWKTKQNNQLFSRKKVERSKFSKYFALNPQVSTINGCGRVDCHEIFSPQNYLFFVKVNKILSSFIKWYIILNYLERGQRSLQFEIQSVHYDFLSTITSTAVFKNWRGSREDKNRGGGLLYVFSGIDFACFLFRNFYYFFHNCFDENKID